jgi:hypothetical protein
MLRLGVVPTWVGERVSWFAGASLRTAHWVDREDLAYGEPHAADVEGGLSTVLAAGAEVPLGARLRLQAAVAQPMGEPAADFGPLISLGLAVGVAPVDASVQQTSAHQQPGGSP